ncbi:MAG: RluA family pseudouridine synthase [Christensenellales bacterium]
MFTANQPPPSGKAAAVSVIFEDNHLLVAEKPYGVPSQADSSGDPDMLSLCKEYIGKKYAKPGNVYLGLVHRLDRPASGVMAFARTSKAAARLCAQIRSGGFERTYLCVLTGAPPKQGGALVSYIVKDKKARISRAAKPSAPGAKKAELAYDVLARSGGLYLVSVSLLTGRFHQIRSQFASVGAPIYGDQKYGPRVIKSNLALYSFKLCFTHPTSKEKLCFSSKPNFHPFTLFEI